MNGNGVKTALPLSGVRILDLTSVIMGPYATQMLAEYGADVIKVEPPEGDIMRGMGPVREEGMGPVFLNLNRGKRSLCLDLKAPGAGEVLLRAVGTADVFITNMRQGALARLGLGWEDLKRHHPTLIYVFLSGFAQDGPYAGRPAYDDLIQGMVGLPALVASAGDSEPRYLPLNIADKTMGLFAAQTVLAALLQRDRNAAHAQGQFIEVPMFETMANFVLLDHLAGASFEPPLGPPGNPRLLSRYRKPYRTQDGWLSTLLYTDRHWESFLRLVGQEALWHGDPRFRTMASRTQHIDAVYAFVEQRIARQPTAHWLAVLKDADIPVARIPDVDALIRELRDSGHGPVRAYADARGNSYMGLEPAARWLHAQPVAGRAAPRLGEHTEEILRELSASEAHADSAF